MRTMRPTFFSVGCAASTSEVSRKTMVSLSESFVGTALFSFEGAALGATRFARQRCDRRRAVEFTSLDL